MIIGYLDSGASYIHSSFLFSRSILFTLYLSPGTAYVYITYNLVLEDDQEYPCVGTYMVGKQDKTYYIMAPSQITDDMRTQAATEYAKFMKTDSYKTYTKAYETFIKKNPGYEDKISEKIGS